VSDNVVHIRNLGIKLGSEFAVIIEALDLTPGEVVVLDAESGAGKSTALGLISGAIAPSSFNGSVHRLSGLDVHQDLPRNQFAGPDRVGFVLQTNVLMPYLNVIENIQLPMRIAGLSPDASWADHLIGTLGLAPLEQRRPMHVSVGQRQRAAIARALLGKPELLLLDEPVSALDPANSAQVENLIQILAQDAGCAVVLASHQAFRGAFSDTRRAGHRSMNLEGVSYSVFSDDPSTMQEDAT